MRGLILLLLLLNLGYFAWSWETGRWASDPYADVPAPIQRIPALEHWVAPVDTPDPETREP